MKWGDFLEIRQAKIKNFGKFHNKTVDFSSGINLIYGENESGKTTLYHFIKSMFFGIEKQRGKAAQFDPYHLYEPWENPSYYEGELRFLAGERSFRLERGFHKNYKKESLINEEDAEELSLEQGDLLQILDGLNESVFRNTLAIGQLKSEPDEELANELKNYTAGFSSSGDGGVNVSAALTKLTKLKKEQEAKKRELERNRQLKISGINKEYEYIQEDLAKKRIQLKEYHGLHKEKEDVLLDRKRVYDEQSKKKRLVLMVLTILLALTGLVFLQPFIMKIVVSVIGVALVCFILLILPKLEQDKSVTLKDADSELNRLLGATTTLKEDIQDKEVQLSNIKEVLEELKQSSYEESKIEIEIKAFEMAYDSIQEASLLLRQEVSSNLNKKASQILAFITDDKYQDLRMDDTIATRLNTKDKIIYKEQVSKGTADEINFSVRMAFLDLFFQEEKMPVILDDAFVMYDDKRLAKVLQYLYLEKRQVLLFTCHTREERLMKQLEIPYYKISLSE